MTLDLDRIDNAKVFGTEGSGHQIKLWVNDNGRNKLIKLNSKYHEASKEVSASKFLKAANLTHVDYFQGTYTYKSQLRNGCWCYSYLNSNEISVPLSHILENTVVTTKESAQSYFNKTVDEIHNQLGLNIDYIRNYILTLMVVDYILMNEDRHLSNIEFIIGPSTVRFSPFFDFGKSFLCRDGIMSKSQFVTLERKFKTKPFSSNPEKNLIDIQYAKVICTKIINNIGDINNLGIPEFHKFVIKQRISRLMNL